MEDIKILRRSAIITLCILGLILGVIYSINMRNAYSYGTQSGTLLDIKRGSRGTDYLLLQPFEDTFTFYFGTQSVTGSGTTGYITGSSTAFPRLTYNANTLKFNFTGAGLQNEGSDVGLSGSLTSYILISGGTGTTNVFTDPTLAGQGTLTATLNANGTNITPTELSYLDGTDSNIETHFTTVEGDIIAHTHTGVGTDSVQVSHNNLTNIGTNSHSTIDSFISSKAQASGLASLDSNNLVVENPASGTTTPAANSIPISDGSGKLSDSWLNSTVTLLGQTIEFGTETTGNTDNIDEGNANLYYLDSRVNSAVGSLSVNALSDVNITMNENDFVKIVGGQLVAGSSSTTVAWSDITGDPTANGSVTSTPGIGLVYSSDGTLSDWKGTNTFASIELIPTGTTPSASANGIWSVTTTTTIITTAGTETVLLLHCDNPGTSTFVDSSNYTQTVTANDNIIGTSTTIFYGGSGVLDGTTDSLSLANSTNWNFGGAGGGDFTLEIFVKFNSVATTQPFFSTYNSANNNGWMWYYYANNMTLWSGAGSGRNLSWTPSVGVVYHLALVRNGGTITAYINGVSIGTYADGDFNNDSEPLEIGGRNDGTSEGLTGYIDEVRILKGFAYWTSDFVPPTVPYNPDAHIQYNTTYQDPINGNKYIDIQTTGTVSDHSYIMLNGSTTIIGRGTTTPSSGTATSNYTLYVDGAGRLTDLDLASTKAIKENIKPIRIKPSDIDSEGMAKAKYISDNKPAWIATNEVNYTYVGSDSASYVDVDTMNNDYNTYVELEWAADLNQPVLIKEIQAMAEKKFWGMFDKVQAKEWNPVEAMDITLRGFIAEEMPEVVLGRDGASVKPMAIIAYMTLAMQKLKEDTILGLKAVRDLATTGTFTVQEIDDRVKILEGQQ